jgi:hypothetical protein
VLNILLSACEAVGGRFRKIEIACWMTEAGTEITVADKVTSIGDVLALTQMLTVTAADNNAQATLPVFLASNNQFLGTMVNQGGGSYSLQVLLQAGTPSSVNIVSNLGAKTGKA